MKINLKSAWAVCRIYLPLVFLSVIASSIAVANNIRISVLVDDPTEIMDQPSYLGMFSTIGYFFWCAISAICIFSWFVLKSQNIISSRKNAALFLLFSGLFFAQLLIDDAFQLHEMFSMLLYHRSWSDWTNGRITGFAQNVAELLVVGLYMLECMGLIFYFRKTWLNSELTFGIVAIAFFIISVFFDMSPRRWQLIHEIEDYSKLFGIFSLLVYYFNYCSYQVRSVMVNKT